MRLNQDESNGKYQPNKSRTRHDKFIVNLILYLDSIKLNKITKKGSVLRFVFE